MDQEGTFQIQDESDPYIQVKAVSKGTLDIVDADDQVSHLIYAFSLEPP
jgi:hypothetical protein